MKRSWKTSVMGAASIITAIAGAATLLLDGNPNTNPDWTAVIAAVVSGFGLIFARDANVTSEQQGLVPPKTP